MIDGRYLSSTLDGAGSTLLRGKNTLADVKTIDMHAAESSGTASAVVTKRQRELNDEYHKKAAEVDSRHHDRWPLPELNTRWGWIHPPQGQEYSCRREDHVTCMQQSPPAQQAAVVTKRQRELNDEYHKKAAEVDLESGTAPGDMGPFKRSLNGYGQKGSVIAFVVGGSAEMASDTYRAPSSASILAADHCSFFNDKPADA
eukprot:CAMPEP_0171984808 /NCGR_PEP_ID=MMETSP0993-20121228/274022_1 /TAXON_ID=483369 /ORGANISM="non described non described, Strain CCMP2098" /LENGTH=200 /DNA_ID=CAMNT_0012637645 /DNA_START=144 /DNA_END=743 /DNA_ORIENTATION=-